MLKAFFLFSFLAYVSLFSSHKDLPNVSEDIISYNQKESFSKSKIQAIYILEDDIEIRDFSKKDIQILIKNKPFDFTKLIIILRNYIDKDINEKNISYIKKIISDYYNNEGHLFVVVTTPEQKIKNGTIKFVVKESKLDEFNVFGNKYFKKSIYKSYMNQKKGESIDVGRLKRNLGSLNKNPFREGNLIFKKGKEENSTSIDLVVRDRWPYRFYGGMDNTGIRSTGSNRYFTGINFGNLWGFDHIAAYQYTQSSNVHRFYSHTMTYTMPVFYRHFLTIYGGLSKIEPKRSIVDLKNDGKSGQASIRYIAPLYPIKKFTHEFDIGFDYKYSNINMTYKDIPFIKNKVNITQFEMKYERTYQTDYYCIPFSLEVYISPGKMISHQSNHDFSELRYRARNQYFYSILHFSPYFRLKKDWSLWINLLNQLSTQNLISSEQFGLGGYNTVRGYPERYINRDNGIVTNIELRSPTFLLTKKNPLNIQFLAFFDGGLAWDVHSTPNIKNLKGLASVGPGIRFNFCNYIVSRLDLGFRLNEIDHKYHYGKIHFSVIGSF